jgi:hypothetical protein
MASGMPVLAAGSWVALPIRKMRAVGVSALGTVERRWYRCALPRWLMPKVDSIPSAVYVASVLNCRPALRMRTEMGGYEEALQEATKDLTPAALERSRGVYLTFGEGRGDAGGEREATTMRVLLGWDLERATAVCHPRPEEPPVMRMVVV